MKKNVVASLVVVFVFVAVPAFCTVGQGTAQLPCRNSILTTTPIMMDGPDKPPFPPHATTSKSAAGASHVNLDGPDKPPFPPKAAGI